MRYILLVLILLFLPIVSSDSQDTQQMDAAQIQEQMNQGKIDAGAFQPDQLRTAVEEKTGTTLKGNNFEGVEIEGNKLTHRSGQFDIPSFSALEPRSDGSMGFETSGSGTISEGSISAEGGTVEVHSRQGVPLLEISGTQSLTTGIPPFIGGGDSQGRSAGGGIFGQAEEEDTSESHSFATGIPSFSGGGDSQGRSAGGGIFGQEINVDEEQTGSTTVRSGDATSGTALSDRQNQRLVGVEVTGGAERMRVSDNFLEIEVLTGQATAVLGSADAPGEPASQVTFVGGEGIRFNGGMLTADRLSSLIRDQTITSNIEQLELVPTSFFVEKADSFQSGCTRAEGISHSSIQTNQFITLNPLQSSMMTVTDCSFHSYEFEGDGSLSVTEGNNPMYLLERGQITRTNDLSIANVTTSYTESVIAHSSALIETDTYYGITCITFNPPGSYFYIDAVQERDFVVEIPENASQYKLCLRKSPEQEFANATGTIDFVDKEAELNERVIFKKYPIRNDKVADLLTTPLLDQTTGNTFLDFDDDLIHFSHIKSLNDQDEIEPLGTQVFANNYYHITEWNTGLDHKRLLTLNWELPIINDDFTDFYSSEADLPYVTFYQNVLTQDNGDSAVTMYPPNHREINELLQ